jgi:hypothetical protein
MTRPRVAVCALALLISACSSRDSTAPEPAPPTSTEPSIDKPTATPGVASKDPAPTPTTPTAPAVVKKLPADLGAHEGKHLWSIQLGTTDSDTARAVAIAPDGAIYIAGYVKGPGMFPNTEPPRGADAYVARLSGDGKLEWARVFGGALDDTADTATVDHEGNVIVAGSFAETLSVGEGSLASAGADDGFIAKFAPDGRRLWVKRIGGRDVDAFHHVAVDRSGNIFATGVFGQTADIGGQEHETRGLDDIFLLKLGPDGSRLWSKTYGYIGRDYGRAIAVDTEGNVLFLCEFSNKIDFGGGEIESNGNRDIALAKLTPNGDQIWAKQFGNDMDELAVGMAVDPAGNIAVTGAFDDAVSFGGDKLTSIGSADIFVARYDTNGNHLWSRRYGEKDEDIGSAIATDSFGNVYATGWFWREVNFTGGAVKSAGKRDLYLLKLSPKGEHLWSKRFGAKESDYAKGVALDHAGNPVLVGAFYFTVGFGGAEMTAKEQASAPIPRSDVFVAKFSR